MIDAKIDDQYIHLIQHSEETLVSFPNHIDIDKLIYYTYNCKAWIGCGTSLDDILSFYTNINMYVYPLDSLVKSGDKRLYSWMKTKKYIFKKKNKEIDFISENDIEKVIT